MQRIGLNIPTLQTYHSDDALISKCLPLVAANHEWYLKGVKAHLLLMFPQAAAPAAGVAAVNERGFNFCVATYEDQYLRFCYDPKGFSSIGQMLVDYNSQRTNYVKKYERLFKKETAILVQATKNIYFNFNPTNITQVREAFVDVVNKALRAQSYAYITESFTLSPDYWVTRYIRSLLPNVSEDELNILLQSAQPSFLQNFEKELASAKTEKALQNVANKYYWVRGSLFSLPVITTQLLKEEQKKTQSATINYALIKRQKSAIIRRAGERSLLKRFIINIERFIAMQDARKANLLQLNYAIEKIVDGALKLRNDWAKDELLSLTPQEFIKWCDGVLPDQTKTDLAKRNHQSVWLFTNEGYYISTDKQEVESIFSSLEDAISEVVSGYGASKGAARGRVKIVLSELDFDKVQEGDILVTSMTRPEFMPVLKKAAAFVTNEGSLTCHAAIVAREMHKPCIIGTKVATKILKDGDLIEADATTGTVKIIK